MWVAVLEWLKLGAAIPDDNDIETDLCNVEKMHNLDGKIILEKKATMKKRGLASPDLGDGLALTFAMPVSKMSQAQEIEAGFKDTTRVRKDYDVLNGR
jgi:hypothetical protein